MGWQRNVNRMVMAPESSGARTTADFINSEPIQEGTKCWEGQEEAAELHSKENRLLSYVMSAWQPSDKMESELFDIIALGNVVALRSPLVESPWRRANVCAATPPSERCPSYWFACLGPRLPLSPTLMLLWLDQMCLATGLFLPHRNLLYGFLPSSDYGSRLEGGHAVSTSG